MKQNKSKNEKKKRKLIKTLLIVLLILLVVLLATVFAYIYPLLKNMNVNTEDSNPEVTLNPSEELIEDNPAPSDLPTAQPTLEITPEPILEMKNNEDYGIINIMVFGMDNRYKKTIIGGRSDVNIILTIDKQKNEIRITSIMRDTLIYIPELDDLNRINAAIVYENGPAGAVEAIEQEFLIDIDHYIVTSFRGMINIIDSIGGVDVTLSQQEVWAMNGLIQEMNLLFGNSSESYFVQRSGTQHLNGIQAVAFMRIRKSGGVFDRDTRQKEVLASARENLKTMSLTDIDNALQTVSNWVKTDMEPLELFALAMELYSLKDGTYKAQRVPYDDMYESVRYQGMSVIEYQKEETLWKMHDFIYNGIE